MKETGAGEYRFTLLNDLSEDNLVAIRADRPGGEAILIWAEVELEGRMAILRQPFIGGFDAAARRDLRGRLGHGGVLQLVQEAMEQFDVDCIRIEQARRISGANPGRAIDNLVFRRRTRDDSSGAPG